MYYSQSPTPAPFAKVIMESGATTARSVLYPSHPRHETQFREFLVEAGIDNVPEKEIFPKLRELPVDVLLNASQTVWLRYQDNVCWPFQPTIDGPKSGSSSIYAVIPDLPINMWRQGRHLRIPVLTGFNTNEGTLFIPERADTDEEFVDFFKTLIPGLSADDVRTLRALYPDPVTDPSSPYKSVPRGLGRQWTRLDAAYSHYAYICPVLQTAHFLSGFKLPGGGGAANSKTASPSPPPVYVYRYAATARWGTANHGDEAPIVAHDLAAVTPGDGEGGEDVIPGLRAVSDAMHGTWADFVLSPAGDPNHHYRRGDGRHREDGRVEWPGFETPFSVAPSSSSSSHAGEALGGAPADSRLSQRVGRLMVFGAGNDERFNASAANATSEGGGGSWTGSSSSSNFRRSQTGTAAMAEVLSDADMERCRFWWDRVELSQGFGKSRKELETIRGKL